uniref:Uncharacterized protein n=1 Tax=Cannabis sativa TaxID=3483 RepID=A0A803QS03_CANSA
MGPTHPMEERFTTSHIDESSMEFGNGRRRRSILEVTRGGQRGIFAVEQGGKNIRGVTWRWKVMWVGSVVQRQQMETRFGASASDGDWNWR